MGVGRRPTSSEKLVAMCLALLAVVSPLVIDRKLSIETEEEDDEQSISFSSWLPLLLVVLIVAIIMSSSVGRNFSSSDPYWIHRIGGSSYGIMLLLMVLALVLRCKGLYG
ncbi:hypothetical protein FRX31_017415 [Thalictrum thalictroides]|uniref:Transmembrane protein n=1 Tax=Thalictrum thalictroides TaxID=46969 RepID=A0A7J6W841_THATH|nr:hypothetical protein FRX31_017415 [Thalictrum thalictroides]